MFEKLKFNKKFYLFKSYIKDKELIQEVLFNDRFAEFYDNNIGDIASFINNLEMIYNSQQITNILNDLIKHFYGTEFKRTMENLDSYIYFANKYNDKKLDILKELSFDDIKKIYISGTKKEVLNLCFKKNYKEKIIVRGRDFIDIYFSISEESIKEKLLLILKNNNLDFFAFIINELGNNRIYIENIDEMFKNEISDKLYEPKTKEKLGDKNFLKLLKEYFSDEFSYMDKKIINKLLEIENYELLKDLIQLRRNEYLSEYVNLENLDISFDDLSIFAKTSIVYGYLNMKERIYFDYYDNLKYCVSNEIFEEFYNKHKDTLHLFNSIRDENFKKLSKSEQNKIYQYIKQLTSSEKQLLIEEIKKINAELQNIYRKIYADAYNKSSIILDKSTSILIKDIHLKEEIVASIPKERYEYEGDIEKRKQNVSLKIKNKYRKHEISENDNVLVYTLENNEPFEFLITVMARGARQNTPNMYGRPSHTLTIENPQMFCKDLTGGSEIISCSMIDDRCINTYLGDFPDIMYVFNDIDSSAILKISPVDAALSPKIEEGTILFENMSPVGPKEFMRETRSKISYNRHSYNEVAIRRKKQTGEKQMPTAILCFDEINSDSIVHAKFFNIPIIVIKTKTYSYINNYTDMEKNRSRLL